MAPLSTRWPDIPAGDPSLDNRPAKPLKLPPKVERDKLADAIEQRRAKDMQRYHEVYAKSSSADGDLQYWADALGVPRIGLDRAKAKVVTLTNLPNSELWWPEEHVRIEHTTEFAGYSRRRRNGAKQSLFGCKRGSTAWLHDHVNMVHSIEGLTDFACLAGCGINAISRSNNQCGGDVIGFLVDDQLVVVWGERDQKEDGYWPGRIGMERVAATYSSATSRLCVVCLPPDEHKDIRQWWQAFCREHSYNPAAPTAEQAKHWHETITSHVKQFGEVRGVDDRTRYDALRKASEAANIRECYALMSGTCGVNALFSKTQKSGNEILRRFRVRCKKSNTCESCAAAKEDIFVQDVVDAWVRHSVKIVYQLVVPEAEADKTIRKIRDSIKQSGGDGGYAWLRMPNGTRRIYTDQPGDILHAMDAAHAIHHMRDDVEHSDRNIRLPSRIAKVGKGSRQCEKECERTARRMYLSKNWKPLKEEPEDPMTFLGIGSEHAIREACADYSVSLFEVVTPTNRDYRDYSQSATELDFDVCLAVAQRMQERMDSYHLMASTKVTLRGHSYSSSSVSPIPNENQVIGKTDAVAMIMRNHSPSGGESTGSPPLAF